MFVKKNELVASEVSSSLKISRTVYAYTDYHVARK